MQNNNKHICKFQIMIHILGSELASACLVFMSREMSAENWRYNYSAKRDKDIKSVSAYVRRRRETQPKKKTKKRGTN